MLSGLNFFYVKAGGTVPLYSQLKETTSQSEDVSFKVLKLTAVILSRVTFLNHNLAEGALTRCILMEAIKLPFIHGFLQQNLKVLNLTWKSAVSNDPEAVPPATSHSFSNLKFQLNNRSFA
jgi:hypothetical protein